MRLARVHWLPARRPLVPMQVQVAAVWPLVMVQMLVEHCVAITQ